MRTDRAKIRSRQFKAQAILVSACCLLLCFAIASAQSTSGNTIKNFRAPLDYFEPPHELQVKSFLAGTEAEPVSDGLILIREAKLQTFQVDGKPEMIVSAPQCIFDPKQETVNSAGPFQMQTSDNKVLLEGVGFFWQKASSNLIISNRVRTTVRGPLTNSFTP